MPVREHMMSRLVAPLAPVFALLAAALANAVHARLGLDLDRRGRAMLVSAVALIAGGAVLKWLEGRAGWEQAQIQADLELMREEAPADPGTGVRQDDLEEAAKIGLEEDLAEIDRAEG